MNIAETLRAASLYEAFDRSAGLRGLVRVASEVSADSHTSQKIVLRLGVSLGQIFRERTRAQPATTQVLWRDLVLWYLNLCYAGTHAVAVTGRFIPQCVRDALNVNYDNRSVKSDTDMVVLASRALLAEPGRKLGGDALHGAINGLVEDDFAKTGVVVMQTKTHWNDSAQIPMLWNILYRHARLGKIVENGFSVGAGLWSVQNLGDFAYSFATVPSNGAALTFTPHQMPVLRVKGMTGGAYWGHKSRDAVCWSLGEFFIKQFNRNGKVWPNVAEVGKGFGAALAGGASIDTPAFQFP